ncbi:hypothetical protein GQ261_08155 [Campylobacter upsaliensis]|nr:hypothetical protein [Campylobacter upsaliensis]EFV1646696.1 hypothetical protein [Campylobacter upsaliensis]
MILARIYPFTRKDIKMKLDRIKEEVACIRTTKNVFTVSLFASIGYFFANVEFNKPELSVVMSAFGALFSFLLSLFWDLKLAQKLKELEKTTKEN